MFSKVQKKYSGVLKALLLSSAFLLKAKTFKKKLMKFVQHIPMHCHTQDICGASLIFSKICQIFCISWFEALYEYNKHFWKYKGEENSQLGMNVIIPFAC